MHWRVHVCLRAASKTATHRTRRSNDKWQPVAVGRRNKPIATDIGSDSGGSNESGVGLSRFSAARPALVVAALNLGRV